MCQCEGLLEKINEKQPNKDYSWLTSTDNEGNLQGGQAKMADQPMARSGHHQGKHFFHTGQQGFRTEIYKGIYLA